LILRNKRFKIPVKLGKMDKSIRKTVNYKKNILQNIEIFVMMILIMQREVA